LTSSQSTLRLSLMPPHKEKIRLTPHFFITQSILRYFVLQGFYIIPNLHSVDNSSLSKFKKFLIVDKVTRGIEQSNDIVTIIESLNKIANTVKKSYSDLLKISPSLSNSKPIFEWNYLGNQNEKRHYQEYLQKEIWKILSHTDIAEKITNQQEIMENPWKILQHGEKITIPFQLATDYFGTISQKTFIDLEKKLKLWEFSPYIFDNQNASLQWSIRIGSALLAHGSVQENDLSNHHSFEIIDLT
jgi:hypothetical protein